MIRQGKRKRAFVQKHSPVQLSNFKTPLPSIPSFSTGSLDCSYVSKRCVETVKITPYFALDPCSNLVTFQSPYPAATEPGRITLNDKLIRSLDSGFACACVNQRQHKTFVLFITSLGIYTRRECLVMLCYSFLL